jgi:hypothetical protein
MSVSSDELNLLVYRYLQESGVKASTVGEHHDLQLRCLPLYNTAITLASYLHFVVASIYAVI